ncbi:MAG: glycosyltransferase family A protein [Pseudomonadota bacterium]
MIDITVCILSYNRPAYLREAVISVLNQTEQPQRIVIYDNGSNPVVLEAMKDLLANGIEWKGAEANRPFIWNFNRAMLGSTTRYTMVMHDDDRLTPNFLQMQTQLLDSDSNIVAASCNGYFIDEQGIRSGGTLTGTEGEPVEIFQCSGHIALKFAGNSCVPFSPSIYRTAAARTVQFREEFGKVCDAAYFCDLADVGAIAYRTEPLYESRLHSGQDSKHFPYDLMNQLEEFFWSRRCRDEAEKNRLHSLLVKQHTLRNIKQFIRLLTEKDLAQAASLLLDKKFKVADAVRILSARGIKNVLK